MAEDYAESNQRALGAFDRGNFSLAARQFKTEHGTLESNEWLGLVEEGMAWHVGGELQRAVRTWLRAVEVYQGFEDRPTISGRSATEGALSFVLNDKTIPYDGEGFEIVLLHAFLAWDYLCLGRLDDAWVEVNLAYDLQAGEEERFQADYGMNRFARFVAAIVQEMDGDLSNAENDLRSLRKEAANNEAVNYSLQRVRALQQGDAEEREMGQLVVLFERGRMPAKEASEQHFGGIRSFSRISVPTYSNRSRNAQDHLNVLLDGQSQGRTQSLERVLHVARQNLEDRVDWLAAKSGIRSIGKTVAVEVLAEEMADEHGEAAGIATGILGGFLNTFTERADLRSWLTLPEDIQVLRIAVPPGEHEIVLQLVQRDGGGPPIDLGTHLFAPGKPVFVTARSLDHRLFARVGRGTANGNVRPKAQASKRRNS